jgi:hypothetical protein
MDSFTGNTQLWRVSQLASTSCPGANLYAHLSTGDLKRRIDELIAAGPVNLQHFCGPDAAATVAPSRPANSGAQQCGRTCLK